MKQYSLYGLGLILIVIMISSVNMGALSLSFRDLFDRPLTDPLWDIWLNIRLPRVLLAVLVGIALATSGVVMQGVFRNPLADAGLLGISSGAALFVGLLIILPFNLPGFFKLYGQIIAAFIGGLVVCCIIYLLSHSKNSSITKLLLAGIAINALAASLIGLISYVADDQELRQLSLWTMGHLGKGQWQSVIISAVFIIPTTIVIMLMSRSLNILQLGDEDAHYLGVNVQKTKRSLLLLSALLIGTAVSVSGIIAFVGLAVPHMLRLQLGADHRLLIPATVLGGGSLLLLADTIARIAVAPNEIPVGLLTSLIGGPYFLWLILRRGPLI
ncbi:iron complex transport system permease protein [Orbus hercynius]|uniref:Iron complex transport system permease protein n=1 Tax=Orbus hercynius TaxID=593135 RepID=A0A495RKB3_9GAMM|nr:iron ABC transporter permease [Orbus hercynius]RKS87740.1 iron complex transport system permease protein [Orbus hercynius]